MAVKLPVDGVRKLNETAPIIRETRDSISDVWGPRAPYYGSWPERVDERILEEPERWIQSACVLCSNGCAMDVGVRNGRIAGVRGRAVDRVNRGRLGPKGLHEWIANQSSDRLTKPLVRRFGKLREASWDDAMQLIVSQSRRLLQSFGPGAIGFYNSVETAEADARRYSIQEQDVLEISSRRGCVRARVRIGGVAAGHLF